MSNPFTYVGFFGGICLIIVVIWWRFSLAQLGKQRLFEQVDLDRPDLETISGVPTVPSILKSYWALPWVLALVVAGLLFLIVKIRVIYCFALGFIAAILLNQLRLFLLSRKSLKLETQLANAIDIMVGALSSGAGITAALESALNEAKSPLKIPLSEVIGKIRLGDDPQLVFRELSHRVPLETFMLFTSTIGVHWEVGGRLAPTLASVGRTIRDRIEMSRRMASNRMQAYFSVVIVLVVNYFIALVMWLSNPVRFAEFMQSSTASLFIATTMVLQAVGILWMTSLSKMKF